MAIQTCRSGASKPSKCACRCGLVISWGYSEHQKTSHTLPPQSLECLSRAKTVSYRPKIGSEHFWPSEGILRHILPQNRLQVGSEGVGGGQQPQILKSALVEPMHNVDPPVFIFDCNYLLVCDTVFDSWHRIRCLNPSKYTMMNFPICLMPDQTHEESTANLKHFFALEFEMDRSKFTCKFQMQSLALKNWMMTLNVLGKSKRWWIFLLVLQSTQSFMAHDFKKPQRKSF